MSDSAPDPERYFPVDEPFLESRYRRLGLVLMAAERAIYAYLFTANGFISDVWISNLVQPGDRPDWEIPDLRDHMPFANHRDYCDDSIETDFESLLNARVTWTRSWGKVWCFLDCEGTLIAALVEHRGPCWSRRAHTISPLALPITDRIRAKWMRAVRRA